MFQKHLNSALEGLKGVTGIADDTFVYGATEEEHDATMVNLMIRSREREESNSTKTKCSLSVRKLASLDTSGPGMESNQMRVRYLQSRR